MKAYRIDDGGATYHVIAKTVFDALRMMHDVDADECWDDIDGIKWLALDENDTIRVYLEGGGNDSIVPRDCTQDDSGHWTATASAWVETMPKGGVLCCSEWP